MKIPKTQRLETSLLKKIKLIYKKLKLRFSHSPCCDKSSENIVQNSNS